jgi:hypothetical protein
MMRPAEVATGPTEAALRAPEIPLVQLALRLEPLEHAQSLAKGEAG